MGLAPAEFWSLTYREFWIKHRAFERGEDRARALIFELAAMVGQFDERRRGKVLRGANALRRYPIKKWLSPEPPA